MKTDQAPKAAHKLPSSRAQSTKAFAGKKTKQPHTKATRTMVIDSASTATPTHATKRGARRRRVVGGGRPQKRAQVIYAEELFADGTSLALYSKTPRSTLLWKIRFPETSRNNGGDTHAERVVNEIQSHEELRGALDRRRKEIARWLRGRREHLANPVSETPQPAPRVNSDLGEDLIEVVLQFTSANGAIRLARGPEGWLMRCEPDCFYTPLIRSFAANVLVGAGLVTLEDFATR